MQIKRGQRIGLDEPKDVLDAIRSTRLYHGLRACTVDGTALAFACWAQFVTLVPSHLEFQDILQMANEKNAQALMNMVRACLHQSAVPPDLRQMYGCWLGIWKAMHWQKDSQHAYVAPQE